MSTNKVLSTTVQADFATSETNEFPPIVIEPGSDFYCPLGSVCYRIFPKDVYDVFVSAGTIDDVGVGEIIEKKEFVTFSNSDRASLKYPCYGYPSIDLDNVFDENGRTTYVTFTFDSVNNELVANKPFFGVGHVTYLTTYKVWQYKPEFNRMGGGQYDGISVLYGMILAHKKKTFVTHQVQPIEINTDQNDYLEVYRVTSKILITPYTNTDTLAGAWEEYSKWPKETWPDTGAPQPYDTWLEYERVHEIGYIPPGAKVMFKRTYHIDWQQPKVGQYGYNPTYYGRVIDKNRYESMTYESPIQQAEATKEANKFAETIRYIDFCDIKSDLKNRYPGIQGIDGIC